MFLTTDIIASRYDRLNEDPYPLRAKKLGICSGYRSIDEEER